MAVYFFLLFLLFRSLRFAALIITVLPFASIGGVFGLGEKGPTKDCKISAPLSTLTLEGVTAIFSVDPAAEKAWNAAKVQGR